MRTNPGVFFEMQEQLVLALKALSTRLAYVLFRFSVGYGVIVQITCNT